MSARLSALGHPVMDTGITKTEKGQRRVDVDDLVAFALALGVTPNRLLMPDVERPGGPAEHALTPVAKGRADQLWQWAQGEKHPPISVPGSHEWLGDGDNPDTTFALANRPYLTGRAVRDEVVAGVQAPNMEITRNLMSAVLGAMAEGADASWVRRIVEITLSLPGTMTQDQIDALTHRGEADGKPAESDG